VAHAAIQVAINSANERTRLGVGGLALLTVPIELLGQQRVAFGNPAHIVARRLEEYALVTTFSFDSVKPLMRLCEPATHLVLGLGEIPTHQLHIRESAAHLRA
jgi:hypothetical protein